MRWAAADGINMASTLRCGIFNPPTICGRRCDRGCDLVPRFALGLRGGSGPSPSPGATCTAYHSVHWDAREGQLLKGGEWFRWQWLGLDPSVLRTVHVCSNRTDLG